MHDPDLPYPIQTLSAKLLLSLVDSISDIAKVSTLKPDVCSGRALLVRILDSFVNKFGNIQHKLEALVEELPPSTDNSNTTETKGSDNDVTRQASQVTGTSIDDPSIHHGGVEDNATFSISNDFLSVGGGMGGYAASPNLSSNNKVVVFL